VGIPSGIFLEMRPCDADPLCFAVDGNLDASVMAQRQIVLADLVILRKVRVEVILAVHF